MFQVKPNHIRRVSFTTRLFPHLNSSLGLDLRRIKTEGEYDGELFCGGRSKNKDLLTFFGFIRRSDSCAAFVQLPNLRRSLRKLTNLVEQELEKVGAQQILLPSIIPQKLWIKSKRLERQKTALDGVYSFKDKNEEELLLGPTFEESITRMVAGIDTVSEYDLPLLFYQTSPKYRFEPNPRFGLLRTNEFIMNDTYSFDANLEEASNTYSRLGNLYENLFRRLGLKCVKIESGTGNIGGKYSHEYQLPVSSGEDTIVQCNDCQNSYNIEMCPIQERNHCLKCGSDKLSILQALELGHTFLLSDIYSEPLNAKFTSREGNSLFYHMGCYGLGLTRIIGAGLDLLSLIHDHNNFRTIQMRWPEGIEPYQLAIVGPAKRSKQYHGGSTLFIERLVNRVLESTNSVDILVDNRDKDGIAKRVVGLQSLGIPNIVVVGQKFLQDQPQVELLKLDSSKINYEQHWFSEDQLYNYTSGLDRQNICD